MNENISRFRGEERKYDVGVVIGVPSRGKIHIRWMMHLHKMPTYLPPAIQWSYAYTVNKEIADARNRIVEEALKRNAKYIMWIDDDVFPPYDVIAKLMKHQKDIITGVYWTKCENEAPVLFKHTGEGPWYDFPRNQLVKVESAGMGCTLVRTSVFEKMAKPYFKSNWIRTLPDGTTSRVAVGEDLYFFDKAKENGFEIYCDTSMLCDHYDIDRDIFYPTEKTRNEFYESRSTPEELEKIKKSEEFQDRYKPLSPEKEKNIDEYDIPELPKMRGKEGLVIGCGNKYQDGWVNLDKQKNVKADVYFDLEKTPLPFEDNSFNYVIAHDVIEHINNLLPLMEEIYRIMKPNGIMSIIVPYWNSIYADCDPTHVRKFNEITFGFFSKKIVKLNADRGTTMSPLNLNCDFDIIDILYVPKKENCEMLAVKMKAIKGGN